MTTAEALRGMAQQALVDADTNFVGRDRRALRHASELADNLSRALDDAWEDGYQAGVARGREMGPVTDGERVARVRGMD